mgnify:CR=1 FL=1
MELYIRSQNKKLLCKFDSLFIEEESYKRKGRYRIMANNGWLGEYNTLERALEVLDEIQNILLPNIKLITRNYTDEELEEYSIKYLVTPPIEDVKIQELSTIHDV